MRKFEDTSRLETLALSIITIRYLPSQQDSVGKTDRGCSSISKWLQATHFHSTKKLLSHSYRPTNTTMGRMNMIPRKDDISLPPFINSRLIDFTVKRLESLPGVIESCTKEEISSN